MEQQTQNKKQSILNSAPDSAGKTFAYVRVSSKTQNEARQLAALSEYGIEPDTIYIDRQSGKDFNRPAYLEMLDALRQGDLLVIGSIDRLGRNYEEIHEQWYRLTREKKVHIRVLDMELLDTRASTDLTGTLIADIEGLDALIRDAVCARGEWPFVQRYIGAESLPRYLTYVRWNPCLVMVVSASGDRGCEVAAQIRENNPNARMLWFSGTDSGVYSYSLHVTYFGLLPATREKIELALDLCRINPQQRMAGSSEIVAQSTLSAINLPIIVCV